MPKLRGYRCACGHRFDYTFMTKDDEGALPVCPSCDKQVTERDEELGGTVFNTIIPMHRTSLKNKAGYVHTHADRPAEKGSVAVPRKADF